jgi:hypothetical protein
MTDEATEMPRCFSISIQSEVAWREALRAFTEPAIWIAPEKSSSFSVSVVLPASGWEMIAKVRRRRVSAQSGCPLRFITQLPGPSPRATEYLGSADVGEQGPNPAPHCRAVVPSRLTRSCQYAP